MDSKMLTTECYSNLVNNINSGIIILNSEKKLLHWNQWIQDHSQFELSNYTNHLLTEIFPDLKNSRIEDAIESALELGLPSLISNIFSRTPFALYNPGNFNVDKLNDDRIQQAVNISRIKVDEDRIFCLIQINDVTASVAREKNLELQVKERKEVESSLLKIETRQRAIMQTMIDALIIFDSNGFIDSFNPAAEKLFGYSENDMMGDNIAFLIEEFSGVKELRESIELMFELGIIGKTKECVAIKCNGSQFPVDISISEIELGNEKFFSAVIRDVSDRKQMDKLKKDFITTVSHELRTPLTSIRGSLGLLCGGIIADIPKKALDLIQVANNNCERLIFLINDILDIEKATSGQMAFEFKTFNLKNLVEQSIGNNASYATQYNVSYKLIEEAKDLAVDVDEHRFQQIMSNLLSNAAKFSIPESSVDIIINFQNELVEIDVKDYGQGIPDKFKENIWNKFTQADTSTTREKGGTGLGLAISKTLTEAMHGTISFTSKEGEGSTFQLRLPLAKNKTM